MRNLFVVLISLFSVGLVCAGEEKVEPAKSELPMAAADGWITLFNGKDLTGWQGDSKVWSVENGYISGKTEKDQQKGNTFLVFNYPLSDYILEAKFILVDNKGNSGIQYRSKVTNWKKWVVNGYQADIGAPDWWGTLYEEGGRGILFASKDKAVPPIKLNDWNQFVVTAKGSALKHEVNSILTGELDDKDEKKRSMEGIIALQYHAPGGFEVRFKDIRIKLLAKDGGKP